MTEFALNLCNRDLVDDDLPRIRACGVTDLLDMHWWLPRAQQLAEAGFRVHQRIDVRGGLGDSEDEAFDTTSKANSLWGPLVATWRRRNEPNLESPGVTPQQWCDWLTRFGKAVKTFDPSMIIYVPAPSPGTPDWLDWLEAGAEAAVEGHFDGMDLHAYGAPGEVARIVEAARTAYDGPILWTEYNFGAGRAQNLVEYAEWLPTILSIANQYGIESVFVFSWEWHKPNMALPTTVNVKGTIVEQALRGLAGNAERPVEGVGGDTVAEFRFGFKSLAEKFGAPVVGQPVTEEEYDKNGNSVQFTTTGQMVYSKTANKPYFFPAWPLPKA